MRRLERPAGTSADGSSVVRDPAPRWLVWAALWTLYLVWGSTYLAIRVMVQTIPPFLGAGVRFMLAGLILFPAIALFRGRAEVRVTRRQVVSSVVIGGLLLVGGNGLVTVAERDVPSGLAALVLSSIPLWVVLLRALFGERVPRGTLLGVAAGFVGVAILLSPAGGSHGIRLGSAVLLVASPILWSLGSFYSKRVPLPANPFVSTATQMLCGGALLVVSGLLVGEGSRLDLQRFSFASIAAFVYLVLVGSLLGFTAFVWLLQNAPISKVATYAYVNPVVAIFLGWAILSEEVDARVLVGAAIIVAAVAFIVRKESEAAPSGPTPDSRPPGGTPVPGARLRN